MLAKAEKTYAVHKVSKNIKKKKSLTAQIS